MDKKSLINEYLRMMNNYAILLKSGPESRQDFFKRRYDFYRFELEKLDPSKQTV